MKNDDLWILVEVEERPSKLNGGRFWRLTFQRVLDNTIAQMDVDKSYDNYRKAGWDHVVHHECPWGVYKNLTLSNRKKTNEGYPVLTADSKYSLEHRFENHKQAREIAQASIDMDRKTRPFDQLFTKN